MKAPCQRCKNRHLHCHDHCKPYQEYNRFRKSISAKKVKEFDLRRTKWGDE